MKSYISLSSLAIILSLLSVSSLSAQMPIGLNFMQEPYQRTYVNPAAQQDVTVQITGLGPQLQLGLSAFRLNNLLTEDPNSPDSLVINLPALAEGPDELFFRMDPQLDILGVAVHVKKVQVGLTFGVRSINRASIDRDFIGLLVNGNGGFIDQTVQMGPRFTSMSYTETGISGSYDLGKLKVGARLKFLGGLFALNTNSSTISLYTDPEYYQLTFTTDYTIQAAGIVPTDTATLLGGDIGTVQASPFTGSPGFAVDLGATYEVTDKLELGLSLTNLGSINWRENATQYTSKGEFTFEGIDPDENPNSPILERLLDFDVAALADTITESFDFTDSQESFRTSLPTRLFLSANYEGPSIFQFGGMLATEFWQGNSNTAIGGYAGIKIKRAYTLGLSYAYNTRFGSQLGLHSHLNLGPFQFFATADNFLGLIAPSATQNASLYFGANLLIGKKWKKE